MEIYRKIKDRAKSLLKVGTVLGALHAGPATAIEEKKFINVEPYVATQMLSAVSQKGGEGHESFVMSIFKKGKWFTRARNSEIKDSVTYDTIVETFKDLNVSKRDGDLFVVQHNHAFGLIYDIISEFKISKEEIVEPDLLLTGPSMVDCARYVILREKNFIYKGISIITEPGGNWVCSGKSNISLSELEENNKINIQLENARRKLIVDSQNKDAINRRLAIETFIIEFKEITGLELIYFPKDISRTDYYILLNRFTIEKR